MSIRSIPLIVFSFILYNIVVWLGGGAVAYDVLIKRIFSIPLIGKAVPVTWGDLLLSLTLVLLFFELLKSTYTSTTSLVDHALSMLVFIACLVAFLLFEQAQTAVFFNIMLATLIDVIAGYTIGIRVARRDIGFGGGMDH